MALSIYAAGFIEIEWEFAENSLSWVVISKFAIQ